MTDVRRVGAVAGVVAAALLLAGCGGGPDKTDAKTPSKAPTVTATPEESDTAEPEETEPEYPPGPEGEIDEKADAEGWEYDSLYDSASDYVQDICDSLPDQTETASPAQWLAEGQNMSDDEAKILTFGVPKLCPKWAKTVKAAVSGTYERWISRGEFEVKAKPKPFRSEDDVQEIGPGTYQAKGKFSNCYWERTTQSGNIIANQFVTQARVLTVTLRVGELFKNEGCGTFKPVG
ncbi:hypothetical protein [Streptomyces sp. NPDC088816]|uniref:hypothetical protein n=1 Tax=Streptomyces sp. NPDC088816 TaxID=3365906 RepID=UPI00381E058D